MCRTRARILRSLRFFGFFHAFRTASSGAPITDNRPTETKYIYTDNDSQGQQLNGKNLYSVTFPKGQVPPVKGFWSLTLYNDQHLFNQNPLSRYSPGTKNTGTLQSNPDGSLTIYAGARSPGKIRKATGYLRRMARSRSTSSLIGQTKPLLTERGNHQPSLK